MSVFPIFINGVWQASAFNDRIVGYERKGAAPADDVYPVSTWPDMELALSAAAAAAGKLAAVPGEQIGNFLERYAGRIEANGEAIAQAAHEETALAVTPRLRSLELPRTTKQLRQAAAAAREASWALPTIDTKNDIRSMLAPMGPVLILGPNNFPLAFNSISGGDFAAALAAGNPVIAKAHPDHPNTTRLLALEMAAALGESELPKGAVQLIYHMSPDTGLRTVSDARLAGLAFTGSRRAGMALKGAADKAGKAAYLEMSSLNPLVILPGAVRERREKIADEFADSALAAAGQFCTNPGLTLLVASPEIDAFIGTVVQRFETRKPGAPLSRGVAEGLLGSLSILQEAGATTLTRQPHVPEEDLCHPSVPNTLLHVTGEQFLADPEALQTEAFGNVSLFVTAESTEQLLEILAMLEGNLTGSIYSATNGEDDELYEQVARLLRPKVGRLLNDRMPTGVELSAAMQHGGPYPATGHGGFTAVGIPASIRRFTVLQSFDHVREARLPAVLRNKNPGGIWRQVDGEWSKGDVG